jgi:poly(hydroxyalkanoate) depolymerase family esterase
LLQRNIFAPIGNPVSHTFNRQLLKASQFKGLLRLMKATQRALAEPIWSAPPAKIASNDPAIAEPPAAPVAEKTLPTDTLAPRPASFTEGVFAYSGAHYPYHLYIPACSAPLSATRMPLIVLLHGCTQTAEDFALGTAMNELAEKHQCMVLYPEQTPKANSARCWNWFEPGHQKRGQGEPGMIAGLTKKVLSSRGGDPARVYIAGLSAGGAMASVVAGLYPELFTALGVHSGLPAGAAQDMLSAFSAMRNGAPGQQAKALPTIVFHGSADRTVHPDNGENISQAALAALNGSGMALVRSQSTRGAKTERSTQRTSYRDASGASFVEHWNVDAGAHAWSGGDPAGSYTDPQGPSASAAMLEFFLQHQKPAPAA